MKQASAREGGIVMRILSEPGFLQKVLLLILGAVLTGLLLPVIKARMDHATFQAQKVFEAKLARQTAVIQAQQKFIEKLSGSIWKYHLTLLEITYDRVEKNDEKYRRDIEHYENLSWELLIEIRSLVASSRWFTKDSTYARLDSFYKTWILAVDTRLMRLVKDQRAADKEWSDFHKELLVETIEQSNSLLKYLSNDFGLVEAVAENKP
jgi:hypothetical protein